MDAEEAAAALDIAAQRALLRGPAERVARGGEEDDGVVARETAAGEAAGVLRVVDAEAVAAAELLDGRDPRRDRVVAVAGGLGEHEDPGLGRRGGEHDRDEQQPAEARH